MIPPAPVPIQTHTLTGQWYDNQQTIRLLAIHTAEGARTDESLADFCDRMNDRSYHDGCDDNSITRMVPHKYSAWHLRGGNSLSLGFCTTGFADWSRATWMNHPKMLRSCAWWLEKESHDHNVRLVKLSSAEVGKVVRDRQGSGVCGHIDYTKGTGDGTHWDPGYNFPWDYVMGLARHYREMRLDEMVTDADKREIADMVVSRLLAKKLDDPMDDDTVPDATIGGILRHDWMRSRQAAIKLDRIDKNTTPPA